MAVIDKGRIEDGGLIDGQTEMAQKNIRRIISSVSGLIWIKEITLPHIQMGIAFRTY